MTNEDRTTTGSSQPDPAEQAQNPPPEDDAILRNLVALMSNEIQNKGNFKTPSPLMESNDDAHDTDNESFNDSATQQNERDINHADKLRRSKRLRVGSINEPQSENEIEVIFDEEADASDHSTNGLADNPSSDESSMLDQPDKDAPPQSIGTRSLTAFELCGIFFLFTMLAGFGIIFAMKIISLVNDYRQSAFSTLATVPEAASGKILQLKGIEFFWREKTPNDRVQEGSNILPVITINSIKGNGTIQIIFKDELGKIRGDTHIHEITSTGNFSAHGTSGIANEIEFTEHKMETGLESNQYWTATINESNDQINWTQIGKYRLTAERR